MQPQMHVDEDADIELDEDLNTEEADARAEAAVLEYTLSSKSTLTAKKCAARMDLDIFKRAVDVF
ncbi:uncharacterized protein yc1106_07668 [Curvularia clavata]|uniref:Uncharacterized protein n=1 Tax=Curvularia clavata TaxID=95742 RepID=A0A9Q9DW08_CURCL|nr:uncharacterized protein yc1106_07668 [Curvularia clavata]